MPPSLDTLFRRNCHGPHVAGLTRIFDRMDRAWEQVARLLAFDCPGCEDNCCRSLFYHHTLLEYLLLRVGFEALPAQDQKEILSRAAGVVAVTRDFLAAGEGVKVMCPLNEEGRCRLYACRPMICRLHGIPHRLERPDGRQITGPGCHRVNPGGVPAADACLDRTPFYRQLAKAEKACREAYDDTRRIKMTVAEMILACCGRVDDADAATGGGALQGGIP